MISVTKAEAGNHVSYVVHSTFLLRYVIETTLVKNKENVEFQNSVLKQINDPIFPKKSYIYQDALITRYLPTTLKSCVQNFLSQ
jgi:hypothetical protein